MIGKVIRGYGKFYTVSSNGKELDCVLRGKIRKDKRLKKYSDPVAVGDIVNFEIEDENTAIINSIDERVNAFTRKGKDSVRHDLIASNLDQIIVIQSFKQPELNLRFVDRIAVRGKKENIPVQLIVNKSDLSHEGAVEEIHDYYNGAELNVSVVSATTGHGIEELTEVFSNKISLLIGYSGVGKTTILNSIYPGVNLKTSEVSESTGKGRHTTTNVVLVDIDENTSVIDTPGLREFGIMDIRPEELGDYFHEFSDYIGQCKFSPCTHDHEPGCIVKELVENGDISDRRYVSYRNILASLREYYDNMY